MILAGAVIAISILPFFFPGADPTGNILVSITLLSVIIVSSIVITKDTKSLVKKTSKVYKVLIVNNMLEILETNNYSQFDMNTFQQIASLTIPSFSSIKLSETNNQHKEFLVLQSNKNNISFWSRYNSEEILIVKDFSGKTISKDDVEDTLNKIQKTVKEQESATKYIFICGDDFDSKFNTYEEQIRISENNNVLIFFLKKTEERIEMI